MARIIAENLEDYSPQASVNDEPKRFDRVDWCPQCQVPLLMQSTCPVCHSATEYCARDLKPVFELERLRFERLTQTQLPPFLFINKNCVYFNGHSLFSFATDTQTGLRLVKNKLWRLDAYPPAIYEKEDAQRRWARCLLANQAVLAEIATEAIEFVRIQSERFPDRRPIISFSGGKDSAVTALLVQEALGNLPLLFGDTTIEFPVTYQYAKAFAQANHFDLFSETPDARFFELCDVLEPPSRIMRWCCTVCKSRPINKFYARFADKVLSFDGIRRMESNNRSGYPRVAHVQKFSRQVVARPIVAWSSFAVWLYMLQHNVEYNPLYDYGYSRVGCMYCPSNTPYNDLLTRENFPDLHEKWVEYLLDYASRAGKVDPETYVLDGYWKRRKIGKDRTFVVERSDTCRQMTEITYTFETPVESQLIEFLKPFGQCRVLGPEDSQCFLVGSQNPLTITGSVGDTQLSVSFHSAHNHTTRLRIEKQIEKYLNCVHCGGCLGVCPNSAISISAGRYWIDSRLCTHCGRCTTTKYLKEGCVALNFGARKRAIRRG